MKFLFKICAIAIAILAAAAAPEVQAQVAGDWDTSPGLLNIRYEIKPRM